MAQVLRQPPATRIFGPTPTRILFAPMNCKTCDYPLWNIETRQCPECGSAFLPSEFRFSLNSVRFCCPGCKTAYYGQSDLGHLIPPEFDCVTCNRHITMDEMVLLPAAGVAEPLTRGESMPWVERARLGRFAAWFSTFGKALSNPGRLISVTPLERHPTEALWYGLSVFALLFSINLGIFFVPNLLIPTGTLPRHGFLGLVTSAAIGITGLLSIIVAALLAYSSVAHLLLMVTGGTNQPFKRTLQCVGYSAPAAVFSVIPCLGLFGAPITLIWWYIAAGQMLVTSHRVSPMRAAFAVGTVPLAVLGLVGVLLFNKFYPATPTRIQITGSGAAVKAGKQQSELSAVWESLNGYHTTNGRYPDHPLRLAEVDPLILPRLVPKSDMSRATVGDVPLNRLVLMSPPDIGSLASAEVARNVPDRSRIIRAGDFLFTCQDLGALSLPRSTWIAILHPPVAESNATVLCADGSTERHRVSSLAAAVEEQNAMRRAAGLPPLPPVDAWP